MRTRSNKAARTTRGMEIVEAPVADMKGEPDVSRQHPKRPPKQNSFTIVETVTGPVAGTFGLSDEWDRG